MYDRNLFVCCVDRWFGAQCASTPLRHLSSYAELSNSAGADVAKV